MTSTGAVHPFESIRRVLVVDDDPVMLEVFTGALRLQGYEPVAFASGAQAWEAYQREVFPLAIVDWKLPDTTGPELCRRFRTVAHARLTFILMATGMSDPADLRTALEAGADDYLVKPFRVQQLNIRLSFAEIQLRHRLERARAEAERDRHQHFQQILLDAIPSPVYYQDTAGVLLGCNIPFGDLLQKASAELVGRRMEELWTAELAPVHAARDRLLLEGMQDVQIYEAQLRPPGGAPRHVIFHKARFYQPDGGLGGLIGVVLDISKRKEAEQALIRSQQLAAIGTLTAGIAHEFNNINTSVLGYLQILRESPQVNPRTQDLIHRAHRSAFRGAELTHKLLSISRPGLLDRTLVDLNRIVTDTLGVVEREFHSEGIKVRVESRELPKVAADATQISQVLINLLINARHALLERDHKTIVVATGVEAERCFVSVTDSGCGVAPEDLPKVFLPFFSTKGEHARGGTAQSSVRGTGLGLSLSDTIVRNHGGSITAESEPGRGSTFTVWLPRDTDGVEAAVPDAKVLGREGGRKARVLVLDDEADVRDIVRQALSLDGHEVVCTGNGHEALALVAAKGFDVVLVDLQMPAMQGSEFLRQLNRIPGRPEAIVITGQLQPEIGPEREDLPPVDLLLKPFDLNHLRSSVRAAVRRHLGRE